MAPLEDNGLIFVVELSSVDEAPLVLVFRPVLFCGALVLLTQNQPRQWPDGWLTPAHIPLPFGPRSSSLLSWSWLLRGRLQSGQPVRA